MSDPFSRPLTRRTVLYGSLVAAAGALIQACSSAPANPTAAPGPSTGASAPTSAPAPAAPTATTAPAPTQPPAAPTPTTAAAAAVPTATPAPAAAATSASKESVELTLGLVSEWDMEGWRLLLENLWNKQHPEIKIKYFIQPPNVWVQTLQTQFQGGQGPDVFFIWGNVNQDWWNSGLKFSMDITDALNADPQGWGVRDDIRKSLRGLDGARDFQIALRLETEGIWYNKDVFTKLGIKPPEQTPKIQPVLWSDVLAWCKTLRDAGYIPISLSETFRFTLHPWTFEIERTFPKWDDLYGAVGKLRYADQPEVKQAWQDWVSFYKMGYLPDGYFGLSVDEQRALWVQQKAAMTFDGHWQWRDFGAKTKEAGFTYGVLPLPSVSKDAVFPLAAPALDSFAASATTKYKEQALAFLKFLASPPTQAWMTDNWRNISVSPGVTYKDPETGMFAQTLEKNLLFKSLSSTYGAEVGTTWDAQIEPVSTGKITVDQALAEIQKKIDAAIAKKKA